MPIVRSRAVRTGERRAVRRYAAAQMVTAAWVTPFPPDRNGGGGQIRQAHLLLGLAERARIHLICPGPVEDPAVRAAVAELTEVAAPGTAWRDEHPWLRRAGDLLAVARSAPPLEVRAFAAYRRALVPALDRLTADVVLVEFAGLAPLLPAHPTCPWLLTFHNLPSRMAAQEASVAPHRRQRWLLRRDAVVALRCERAAAVAFDAVITCTAADATQLAPVQPVIVPNGVDAARFPVCDPPAALRVVFTGALYTAPNVDGARWLCREVLPRVREQVPEVELDLVGARPTGEVRALGYLPGVTLHADVPDITPFLAAARVAVVPLRIGSGSRLKALEAMAANRPVVGTSIGLEGLDLTDGREALVANDAEAFAAAVVRVLRDDAVAGALARAGRAAAQERFEWSAIVAAFSEAVLEVAARAGKFGDSPR